MSTNISPSFLCNKCAKPHCNIINPTKPKRSGGDLHVPIKRTFKLVELALAHPQSLNNALQQFPDSFLKDYLR